MMACLVKVFQSLLTIVTLSVIICASTQQVYHFVKSKSSLPFNALTCRSSPVYSLSECAFLAGESKTVTFFYNRDTYQCQWDCVFIFNGTCLTMCQSPWIPFEIKWGNNAALNKLPGVSSVFGTMHSSWGAHYATDGILQTGRPFFHSNFETIPWIMIDLQQISHIFFIRVYNRGDGGGNRFHDVAVEVSNSSVFIQRGFYKGPGVTRQVIQILCDHQTIAQKVRLRIITGSENTLNIPELEVYTL